MRFLGGMDTMFAMAESSTVHMHVTGVMRLRPRPGEADPFARIREVFEARIAAIPPLRWRLVEPPGGMGELRWVEDRDFDLDRHLTRTVLDAGSRLEDLVSSVASTPLERDRPLWKMEVVEGLADGTIAVVSAFHHAFMDGGAGMEAIGVIFDLDPDAGAVALPDDRRAEALPGRLRLLADIPRATAVRLGRLPSAALATLRGGAGVVGAMFPTRPDGGGASLAPRTPFNGALGPERRVAFVDAPFDHVRTAKEHFGTSVNDVVLAAVAAALRRSVGADAAAELGPMIAAVPVSVRNGDDVGAVGNRTSAMMVPLPTDVADPAMRLSMIGERAERAKASHRSMGTDLIEQWAGVVPPWVIAAGAATMQRFGVADRLPPVFNAIVSNVAGPPVPIYLGGSEVIGLHPLGPLLDGGGLNITVMSSREHLHIGVIADPMLVPDPGEIARDVAAGIEELHGLAIGSVGEKDAVAP